MIILSKNQKQLISWTVGLGDSLILTPLFSVNEYHIKNVLENIVEVYQKENKDHFLEDNVLKCLPLKELIALHETLGKC